MPKVPMNYSKCCIYKIEHNDNESLVYVGHTTNFEKRKTHHKYYCKKENDTHYNLKVYQMIRQNGDWEMFKMIEVQKYPCADRREAERRENEVMKELRASMNTKKSFRTQDELTEYRKEYGTNYREVHKEKKQQQMKEYYESNKTKIQEINKEYRENNKPKIQERGKKYYEANKQKINEKVKCECGCEIVKQNLKKHQARKKHLDKMKNI